MLSHFSTDSQKCELMRRVLQLQHAMFIKDSQSLPNLLMHKVVRLILVVGLALISCLPIGWLP